MLQFSANAFFWAGRALRSIRGDCFIGCVKCLNGKAAFHTAMDLDEKARLKALSHLPNIEQQFRGIGLYISADTTRELVEQVEDRDTRRNFQWLHDQVESIEKIAEKELNGKFFLYIPNERIRFWPNPGGPGTGTLFGHEVDENFPSAGYDIQCSGITFGTAMTTACVFHLMRVMEIGLAALGNVFGVSTAHSNWETVINQIESKIAGMRSDPAWKSLPDCKEQQEYYSQAAAYFRTVKDAWRNHTMHARSKYTEEEAEQIFNAVKGFMQKLAERLSE